MNKQPDVSFNGMKSKQRPSKISITATITDEDTRNTEWFTYHTDAEKRAMIGEYTTCPRGWSRITGDNRATIISRIDRDRLLVEQGHEPRDTREIVGLEELSPRPKIVVNKPHPITNVDRARNAWLTRSSSV